jgi:tetratricopeptide (TPR) repeat protein
MLLSQAEKAYREGALEQARAYCQAVLQASPDDARALFLLASVAADTRQVDEGLKWARRAVQRRPGDAAGHYALGRVWEAAERYGDAEASYRAALARDASDAKTHNNLGAVLHMQGRLDEALGCYRRALEIDPAQPQANQNLAAIVRDPAAQELAIQGYLRHIALNPKDAGALHNLGNIYADLGRNDEALASFGRALALEPGRAETHFARAFVLLLCGDYAAGWEEYAWRWRIDAFNAPARRFAQPMWNGSAFTGGSVLLHGESGLGDTLHFLRYAPLVAQRCGSVVLECQPQLEPLLRGMANVQVIAQGAPLPPFVAHAPLIELPRIFGTTLATIPWPGPYVHADEARMAQWRALLPQSRKPRMRIGLAWTGSPHNMNNRKRSLTLSALAPLAQLAGAQFFSLQKGEGAEQASAPPRGMELVDLTARIADFADTAALVGVLDLVITIDTAVAHLAGAMGAPTWVLLAHSPDWRYHVGRSDNPWYPSQRLFRQPQGGDWDSVVNDVVAELAAS